MNFYKHPFHQNNSTSTNSTSSSIRDSSNVSSSSSAGQTSSPLNGSVRFNDLISAQPKFNEREKYLTA
jgi:hypothetical protein